ncbi:MAG: hypothetical protein WCD70_03390 [Alphaproteobacteria bacterium]
MPAAKKPKRSKNRYARMAPRTQVFCYEIEARSAEEASKALWRKLRFNDDSSLPMDAALVTSNWDEPEKHNEWIIAGGELPEITETSKTASGWNGKDIVCMKLV